MDPRQPVPEAIREGRIIAIGRGVDPTVVVEIGQALLDGGIRAFEVTLNRPGALEAIRRLVLHPVAKELLIGAGTILTIESAEQAVAAGARFLVMPHLDVEVIAWAQAQGIPVVPGALTPTEILAAWRAGATAVKLFPASAVGPTFIREMAGPLPEIPLIPTGGVTLETAPLFLDNGALAVGVGRWLTDAGDVDAVRNRARLLSDVIARSAGRGAG